MEIKDQEDDPIAGEDRKWIPEGQYVAKCIEAKMTRVGIETRNGKFSRMRKVVLIFEILESPFDEDGDHYKGEKIPMYLNAEYEFFPPGSKFYQTWVIANDCRKPKRKERMPLKIFLNKIFLIRVVDVQGENTEFLDNPQAFRYSRVDRVLKRIDEPCTF